MNDYLADPRRTGPAPADRAANWALGVAFASVMCAGAGVWLAINFGMGLLALALGMSGWVICWAVGMGFALGALKNAYSSATPAVVRKKAWGAIGISAFSLVLVVLYIFALVIAAQQLAE